MSITSEALEWQYWLHLGITLSIFTGIIGYFQLYGLEFFKMFVLSFLALGVADIISHLVMEKVFGWSG